MQKYNSTKTPLVEYMMNSAKKEEMHVDIWGSCISRDIFNEESEYYHFIVDNYYSGCTFFSQFKQPVGPMITREDIANAKISDHNFNIKCALADYNKTVIDSFKKSSASWCIIDFRYIISKIASIEYSKISGKNVAGGEIKSNDYISAIFSEHISKTLNTLNVEHKISLLDPLDLDMYEEFEKYCEFLLSRYGNNIILIETFEAFDDIDAEGRLKRKWKTEHEAFLEKRFEYEAIRKLKCHLVKAPYFVPTDSYQRWGVNRVHYIGEYYIYGLKSVEAIIRCNTKIAARQEYSSLNELYLYYGNEIAKIRYGKILSTNNTLKRIEHDILTNKTYEAVDLIKKLVEQKVPESFGLLGRAYRDGLGYLEKDVGQALYYYNLACEFDINWAKNEYFDFLWSFNDENKDLEAVKVISSLAETGNEYANERLARAYLTGRGVKKDILKAADLFRLAVSKGHGWANIELFDVLQLINTPESLHEAFNVIDNYSKTGNNSALIRKIRCYRDGIGTKKDLEMASKTIDKITNLNQTDYYQECLLIKQLFDEQTNKTPGGSE